jgi:3-phosphoshikimate 1-carboxyvinyltransferase
MPSYPATILSDPVGKPDFSIAVPGSKSISNRALPVAALARGTTVLHGVLQAEDTEVMLAALRGLGFSVEQSGGEVRITGADGAVPAPEADLDMQLSGTSIRFLTALLATARGSYRLYGIERMHERPIGDLLDALNSLGADTHSEAGNGCPPVLVNARGLEGGTASVAGDRSSQFLSALLLAAPYARTPVTINVTGELQSRPFVDMTLKLMEDFGVTVNRSGYDTFSIRPGGFVARDYRVEGDATSAGYFWVAAAVTGGRVRVTNVGRNSSQGDRALADILGRMGCRVSWTDDSCEVQGPPPGELRGGSFDLNDIPDQALALAVAGLFTREPLEITNVWNMRIKETDRLSALAVELAKLGAGITESRDGITVSPAASYRPALIGTYGDHRMAMAFAIAGLRLPGVTIADPGCVAKTYPRFWSDWQKLRESAGAA